MAKTSNVYKDKKTGKYYFVASLGFDLKGKRIQKFKRGFKTAKEAKKAYNQFMIDYQEKRETKNIINAGTKIMLRKVLLRPIQV